MILAVIYKINKNGNLSKGVNIIYTHHPYAMTWALFVGCKLKMSGSLETHLLVFQNNRGKRFCYTFTVYNIHLYCFSSEVWYSANVLGQYQICLQLCGDYIQSISKKYNNSKCFSSLREQKSSKDLAQHLAAANLINTQSEEYFNSSLYNTLSSDVFQIS